MSDKCSCISCVRCSAGDKDDQQRDDVPLCHICGPVMNLGRYGA